MCDASVNSMQTKRWPIAASLAVLSSVILMALSACGQADHSHQVTTDSPAALSPIKILAPTDPFAARAMPLAEAELERGWGQPIEIETTAYDDVRRLIQRHQRHSDHGFDIVAFDVVWLGELVADGSLEPLDQQIAQTPALAFDDLVAAPLADCQIDGMTYGLPIQPHAELLWYRTDWFTDAGLTPPQTTDEILTAAARLTNPENGRYGICWNAQRGQPLGQSMAHFYAAFGAPLLDEAGRPALDSPQARQAAAYAKALLEYSPPDILLMAWDQRTSRFADGSSAMTYGWSARAYLAEEAADSKVSGLVGYAPAPVAPGIAPITPLGTWSLAVPTGLPDERRARALECLLWLSQPAQHRLLAGHGSGGIQRHSLLSDDALQRRHPAFITIDAMAHKGHVSSAMRPAIPQWHHLCQILGTVYFDMLRGDLTIDAACAEAQRQALALWDHPPTEP